MSNSDRERWDHKWLLYKSQSEYLPSDILKRHVHLLTGGIALDLACGRGQNGLWLAQQGYRVLAVDISRIALQIGQAAAAQQGIQKQISWVQADLEEWQIPPQAFDLVCVFRFLDRRLFSQLQASLKPKGLLLYETRHVGVLQFLPEANRDYLLERGELLTLFPNCQTLFYEEGQENAGILVQSF